MKKMFLILAGIICLVVSVNAQVYWGKKADQLVASAEKVIIGNNSELPLYVQFQKGKEVKFFDFEKYFRKQFSLPASLSFRLINKEVDADGCIHHRMQQVYKGVPIENMQLIVHTRNGLVEAYNGKYVAKMVHTIETAVTKEVCLQSALKKVNAEKYRWESLEDEKRLKRSTGDATATYYPEGTTCLMDIDGTGNFKMCYKFEVQAIKPLLREIMYVDASSSEVVKSYSKIRYADYQTQGKTHFNGNKTITTSDTIINGVKNYRLRDRTRGKGIETYNLDNTTDYSKATDFFNTSNNWSQGVDSIAVGVHWATEQYFDFLLNNFGRQGIDNEGFLLMSYLHYDVDYINAFWDGYVMTYGDGGFDVDEGVLYQPLTSPHIVAHEITHGLIEKTANLIYSSESGAINEGICDIFGAVVESSLDANATIWQVGDEVGAMFRNMKEPKKSKNPDTYKGMYWDPGQEVHQNGTIMSHWFYVLAEGEAGMNDYDSAYSVTGIGKSAALQIVYKALTMYCTPSTTFDEMRNYSILVATNIHGFCSKEVKAVTDAWYAVGVGNKFSTETVSDFEVSEMYLCPTKASVKFTNYSINSDKFLWDFGDGATSTEKNPVHTYASQNDFDVKLTAFGMQACNSNDNTKTVENCIVVNDTIKCTTSLSNGDDITVTDCAGLMVDNGNIFGKYSPNINRTLTIAPTAKFVALEIDFFDIEAGYDYLTIFDGSNDQSPEIESLTGWIDAGKLITSSSNAITLNFYSDEAYQYDGFEIRWQCFQDFQPPVALADADEYETCTGIVNFINKSGFHPTEYLWDFGDGTTSIEKNPTHNYKDDGEYYPTLTVKNSKGSHQFSFEYPIFVAKDEAPTVIAPESICENLSTTLIAVGSADDFFHWTDSQGYVLGTEMEYETELLTTGTNYYVENYGIRVGETSPVNIEESTENIGAMGFRLSETARIETMKVFAKTAKKRTFVLESFDWWFGEYDTIFVKEYDLKVGENTIEIAETLTDGEYYISIAEESPELYFHYTEKEYVNETIELELIYDWDSYSYMYPYFYEWNIIPSSACFSNKAEVVVDVQKSPDANFTYQVVNKTVTLSVQSPTADNYVWTLGDAKQYDIANPSIVYETNGLKTVTLAVSNACGVDIITKTIQIGAVTLVSENDEPKIQIYPNPAHQTLTVECERSTEINIYSIDGKLVLQKAVLNPVNELNISSLTDGIYMLKVVTDKGTVTRKLVKE